MVQNPTRTLVITGGPSKWDFMLALFDGNLKNRRSVIFQVEDIRRVAPFDQTIKTVINEIAREDGSGENWIFKGYRDGDAKNQRIQGYYSTKDRRGTVEY